jgi:hypothetical protein
VKVDSVTVRWYLKPDLGEFEVRYICDLAKDIDGWKGQAFSLYMTPISGRIKKGALKHGEDHL